ncbi:putative amidophosphoribosyltransferase [Opitutaceae bacterium TAV1]|nr:putative amidophosphoribosyltransferase [Opitutaceae bacterium TAV1]
MRHMIGHLVRGFADVVFPPRCVACHGLVEQPAAASATAGAAAGPALPLRHVCATCEGRIRRAEPPHCPACGFPYSGEADPENPPLCEHCEGLDPAWTTARTTVLLAGPARALVHELKYHRGQHVLPDIEAIVRGHGYVCDFLRGAVLVPVPLHPRKERERGFNQSALLAGCFARATGGEATGTRVAPLLRRVLDTQTQTTLSRAARRANLKNAFALAGGPSINPDQHYILIDDVFTTGSTLNACARVLRRAGVVNLDVVTFGHG